MSTADINSILPRIQKLLALAGNNPNEAEAALAMERAQELLAAYNLDLAQLDLKAKAEGRSAADAPRTKEKVERSAMFKYQRRIWEALAGANFCVYWSQKIYHTSGIYSTHHHYLIGRTDNVTTVKMMGDYLETTINRLCPYKSGKDVNLWKEGCAERICERLYDKKWKMQRESEQAAKAQSDAGAAGGALVLATVYQSEEHLNYVFQYGNDRWCNCANCRARRDAEYRKAELERLEREGPVAVVVNYDEPEKPETDAQRRKREEREERQRARWREQYWREQRKEEAKRNSVAFQSGREKGDDIGLDSQINPSKPKGRLE